MITFARVGCDPAVLQQLTGLSPQAFVEVLPAFVEAMR